LGYGQKRLANGQNNSSWVTCESPEIFTSPIDQYYVTDGKYIQGVNSGYSNVIMVKFIKNIMVLQKRGLINLLFSNRGADIVYSIQDDTQPSGRKNLGMFNKTAMLDKFSIADLVAAVDKIRVYNYTTPRHILYNLINDDNVQVLPIDIAIFDMGEINLNVDSEKLFFNSF
jgi:hypothetical protein